MSACKTLVRTSLFSLESSLRTSHRVSFSLPLRSLHSFPPPTRGLRLIKPHGVSARCLGSIPGAVALVPTEVSNEDSPCESPSENTVEHLLMDREDVTQLMKMERKSAIGDFGKRWFPYLDRFNCGASDLSSGEVLEALDPLIMDVRKERFRNAVRNRSYSVCLVVEGLCDFGNVSAAFRSADALGFQSVHVVSCDSSKRYRENRHVSMGAEKWLDIELWNSTQECFRVLRSRGYRIATTHLATDAVSIYDMNWSYPTAIVVGNENRGISDEALQLSDLHCSIPMKGMVDSFNVSVAAGILMHHAVFDRTSRLGHHGDLTMEESQILLAEFSLRHSKSAISIAHEYAKRRDATLMSKL
ncbi:tRNA (guanosine(18)-2'-O)-methyltransferase [Rhodamnia argentea]|uniref:tRNA (Guanosine(18)-2'-O)-methyltransferase n=1 Tax=Rhodamnia argentea TaxID=178133 RepID=A0A8B8MUJ4_9MYRT|nr:tRNA (guanosine(18)-2'-O)-methyltransferase [Rhodamnia argentea]